MFVFMFKCLPENKTYNFDKNLKIREFVISGMCCLKQ